MRRGLAGLLLLVPCLALAEDRFDALRAQARPYDGALGQFLEEYLGDCGDNPNCRSHTKDFQAQSKGERFYALVREDEAAMLGMSERPSGGGEYTVEVTPFFPGNEHALTNATPKKTDPKGNPILPVLMLPGSAARRGDGRLGGADVQEPRGAAGVALPPRGALGPAEEGRGQADRAPGEAGCDACHDARRGGAGNLGRSRDVTRSQARELLALVGRTASIEPYGDDLPSYFANEFAFPAPEWACSDAALRIRFWDDLVE